MKPDAIDRILQLTYLDGRITTRGLVEKVAMKHSPIERMSRIKTRQLHDRLVAVLDERKSMSAMKGALTLGEYLSVEITARAKKSESVIVTSMAKKAGMTASQLTQLCRDTLSPLDIPAEAVNALMRFFKLPARAAGILIRNSIRCAYFHPSLTSALARYDAKYSQHKSIVMQKAIRELFVKADIHSSPDQEKRINDYVTLATDGLEP